MGTSSRLASAILMPTTIFSSLLSNSVRSASGALSLSPQQWRGRRARREKNMHLLSSRLQGWSVFLFIVLLPRAWQLLWRGMFAAVLVWYATAWVLADRLMLAADGTWTFSELYRAARIFPLDHHIRNEPARRMTSVWPAYPLMWVYIVYDQTLQDDPFGWEWIDNRATIGKLIKERNK